MSSPERGSVDWAIPVVASTLATGTPTRRITAADVEEAAGVIVGSLLVSGHRHVPVPSGVWDLAALRPGEALSFAHERLDGLFDAMGLSIEWTKRRRSDGVGRVDAG